jgi:hypothetical protein
MATLTLDELTPIELAKRFAGKNSIFIIESMSETNEILIDAVMGEASDGTVNKTTQRISLPVGTRRIYGQPIGSEASKTRQIEDGIEMLEDYSDVDANMVDHSPSKAELLDSEDRAFLEGMGQTQADDLLYAKKEDGLEFIDGIYTRLPATADNSTVFKVETSGSNFTSIILVKWSPVMTKLIYPKGRNDLGVKAEFRGKQDIQKTVNGVTGTLPVYRTFYSTHFGITLRDPRAVKRICNINPLTSSVETIAKQLIAAKNKLPKGAGTIVAYMNSDVLTLFEQYTTVPSGRWLAVKDDPWGKPTTMLGEIRFRQVDAILNTESLVS